LRTFTKVRHQISQLQQVYDAQESAPLTNDELGIGRYYVRPLRPHRAKTFVADAQQEPCAIPVVALADTDEFSSTERMGTGASHAQDAPMRPESVHFVLIYKRLEKGRFRIPAVAPGTNRAVLDATELTMLLDGIDLSRVKRPTLWNPPVPDPT
jgi:hypothetical protein